MQGVLALQYSLGSWQQTRTCIVWIMPRQQHQRLPVLFHHLELYIHVEEGPLHVEDAGGGLAAQPPLHGGKAALCGTKDGLRCSDTESVQKVYMCSPKNVCIMLTGRSVCTAAFVCEHKMPAAVPRAHLAAPRMALPRYFCLYNRPDASPCTSGCCSSS